MPTVTVKHTIEELAFHGRTLTVEIEAEATVSKYDPGNTCGPPENCYPPEGGEVEDVEFTILAVSDWEKSLAEGSAVGVETKWPQQQIDGLEEVLTQAVDQWYEANPDPINEAVYALPPPEPDYD